jgi:hypothetical protein
MANIKLERWPWEEPQQAGPYDFALPTEPPEERGFLRGVGDVATQFAAGIPYAARGVVGLAGMVPGLNVIADPLAEKLGEAGQYIEESLLSDYAQRQRQELAARQAQEEGFLGQAGATLGYLAENPSMIPGAIAQSIPSMIGGGLVGAGIRRGAQGLGLTRAGAMSPLTTGAVGEGAMIAGTTAAEIAAQNPEEFAARYYGLPAGVGGAAVSLASGRLLGASDIDTMIAQRLTRNQLATGEAKDMLAFTPGMAGRVARGALGEGLLEEAPQSAMEQVAVNLGTNRPAFEDLGGDVAMGAVTGAFMGAGAGVGRPRNTYTRQELATAQQIAADENMEPRARLEALDFIRRVEIGQLGPEEAQARFAAQTTTPFEPAQFTPYEAGQFSPWQSPRDILAGQGLEQVETGGLVAPGIRQLPSGVYAMEPQAGGVTGELGPRQLAALAGPPTGRERLRQTQPRPVSGELGLQQQQALAGPGPRPVTGELGLQQQQALAGPGPRPVTGELGSQRQAALAGPQPTPSSGTSAASLPAAPAAGLSTSKKPAAPKKAEATPTVKRTGKKPKAVLPSTEPVIVNYAKLTDEEIAAAGVPDAEDVAEAKAAAKEVEELVTEEDIKQAGGISGRLQAKVASEPGQAKGRVTLPQGVLAGIVSAVRSLKTRTPVVYKTGVGKAEVDVPATRKFGEQMNNIRNAVSKVVAVANQFSNAQSNAARASLTPGQKAGTETLTEAAAAKKAEKETGNLETLRQQLINAIEELRAVAGTDRNVEAVVAVFKGRAQRELTKKTLTPEQFEKNKSVDTLLSQYWAQYKDGSLVQAAGVDNVRGRPIRLSWEAEAAGLTEQPLVNANADGYSFAPGQPLEKGIIGVLNYISSHGSAFERLVARAIRTAIKKDRSVRDNVKANTPKVEWIPANQTPAFDPKKNTIYLHETASPEQSLHEALHGALQWFVYQNPNLAEVLRLDRALQKVLDYKGEMSPKAKEVIDVLRKVAKGRSKTARLDAILELISYGTTLNEFRQLLKSLETAETPEQRGLLSGLENLMRRITALLQRFLGVSNTVANDVLDATFALLEQASTAEQVGKRTGNILNLVDATTAAFKRWFGNSKVVNKDGTPKVMYHGTARDIKTFKPKQANAIFLTDDPQFAETFTEMSEDYMRDEFFKKLSPAKKLILQNQARKIAKREGTNYEDVLNSLIRDKLPSRANIMPLYVRAENPFDYQNKEHVSAVIDEVKRSSGDYYNDWDLTLMQEVIQNGSWKQIEDTEVQNAIRKLGFDSFYVNEGGKKNIAVYDSSQLKSATGNQGAFDPTSGNILEAAVASQPNLNQTNEQAAKAAGYPNLQAYKNSPGGSFNPTRMFFEALGFGQAGYSTNKIREAGKQAAAKIRKDYPTLERYILAVNSRFSNPPGLDKIIEFFKSKQNTGILEMEKITEYLQRSPKDAEAVLNYLDGDTKALDGIKHKDALKAIADNVTRHLKMYIEDLPEGSKERKLFESLKFTEYLLNPESVAQLAGKSFGMKKLSTLLGIEPRSESEIEAFKDLLPKKADGSVDLDAPLYQVFETKPNKEGNLERMPWGFISKEMADKNPPAGLDIGFDRVWRVEKFSDEGYRFVSRTTTPQQVREMAKKQEIDKLSAALLNTMSALSHNYASRYYFNGLAGFGREGNTAEGKATPRTVAFNNVEEINEVFKDTGRIIDNDNVLQVSDQASKMKDIRKTTQRTGTWVQLPDTPTYGQLAGKIIPGPVWNSMLDMHDRNPLFNWQALNTTMTFFKKAKTVYTPATHVNNVLTNYSLMLLYGIPHSALKDAANLFIRFEANPGSLTKDQLATMQAFYASGAVLGQFTTTEAKQTIAKALSDNISPDSKSSFLTTLADLAKVEKGLIQKARSFGKNADTFMTNAYAAGDNIFRLAAFLNTAGNIQFRDNTKTLSQEQLEEAGIAARKMFLDYDIDARAVRAARQSFMPFISWSYAIMPVLGRIAIEKPWAMVNMMAALAVMSAVMGGEDDDEIRREGPDSLRQKTFGVPHYMRIPFMGDAENPVYYNIGKSIPMMALFQPSPQETKLAGQEWIPGFLNPSGPYASLMAGMFFGIDPFTGKQISQPTDTQWDKLVNTGQSVYNTMAPSFAQTRFADQAKALAEGRVGPTGNETNALFLARTLGGMSLYQFNRDESRFYQNLEVKKIQRDFSTAMNRAKREELRKGYPDYEALDKDLEVLRKRMDKALADIMGQDDSSLLDL